MMVFEMVLIMVFVALASGFAFGMGELMFAPVVEYLLSPFFKMSVKTSQRIGGAIMVALVIAMIL